jgi:hypothetical protein
MKARIGDWRIEADVTRDLASNPHRVEAILDGYGLGNKGRLTLDLAAGWADRLGSWLSALGVALDEIGCALMSAADADSCDRCGMPCDPGETYCPTCEEASR